MNMLIQEGNTLNKNRKYVESIKEIRDACNSGKYKKDNCTS